MPSVRLLPALIVAVLPVLLTVACGDPHAGHDHGPGEPHAHDAHTDDGAHAHEAPHGGTLVVLGDEHAHIELVHDRATGALQLYALGAHADGPVRLTAPSVAVEIIDGETAYRIELAAVPSGLTGETVGDTSLFEGRDDRLIGRDGFSGRVPEIDIRGGTFRDVAFSIATSGE